ATAALAERDRLSAVVCLVVGVEHRCWRRRWRLRGLHGHARRRLVLGVTLGAANLRVAELGQHRLASAGVAGLRTAVWRDAGRRRDRELLLGRERLALHLAHAPQVVLERQRRRRTDADAHALPVLTA